MTKTTEEKKPEGAVTPATPSTEATSSEKATVGASREERTGIAPGMTIRVHQRIKDVSKDGKERERVQIYEGIVLSRHGGVGMGATMTVRKLSGGIGVEKIFPIWLPTIEKIDIVSRARVRRAKLGYLRNPQKKLKKARKAAK